MEIDKPILNFWVETQRTRLPKPFRKRIKFRLLTPLSCLYFWCQSTWLCVSKH